MNRNPTIKARKHWWDERIVELVDLVLYLGYRLKDLSAHFGKTVGAIASVLHRRELSLVGMRYRYAKELSK